MSKVYSNWVGLICLLAVGTTSFAGLIWQPVRAQEVDAPTVLITGSNRGIGLEFARQYAAKGWNVIATARSPDSADELNAIAEAHSNLIVETLDVTDLSGIAALAEKYEGTAIDVLINNAGILGNVETQELGQFDYANFQQIMAVNTFGPLAVSQAFLDHVSASDQKKIITLASGQGSSTLTQRRGGNYFYRASKAAVNITMRALAADTRDLGIKVGILGPGMAKTRLLAAAGYSGPMAIEPSEAASGVIQMIETLDEETAGRFFNYDGTELPW